PIVRAVETVPRRRGLDEGVDHVRLRGRHGERQPPPGLRWEPLGIPLVERAPGGAPVGALEEAAAARSSGTITAGAERPTLAPEVPQAGVERLRMTRVHGQGRATGRAVRPLQDLLPGLASVGRLVEPAIVAVAPQLPGHADVDRVRLARIDHDS